MSVTGKWIKCVIFIQYYIKQLWKWTASSTVNESERHYVWEKTPKTVQWDAIFLNKQVNDDRDPGYSGGARWVGKEYTR